MKRYTLLFGLLLVGIRIQAQTKGIQYQAVIQDPAPYQIPGTFIQGQVLQHAKVSVRFTLKTNGTTDFEEIHETQTDDFGLINLTIGQGKKTSGSDFDQLHWNAQNKILVVEVKIANQNDFMEVSNQTLLYSPYALYADAVEYKHVNNAPKDISHFTNDVGYLVPIDLEPLEHKIDEYQLANLANFSMIRNQQITLETIVAQQGKILNETVLHTQNMNVRIEQQNNQIIQNQSTVMSQINSLGASFESLSNKSLATDLGNTSPSNQLYPSQRAVKSYIDQAIANVRVSETQDATTLATGKIQLAGDLGGTATLPTVPALVSKEELSNKSIDVTADAASDIKYPSVRAVKSYVDQATLGIALYADLSAKADKLSPVFAGTPSLPTGSIAVKQGIGSNTNQLATTSFVQQELSVASLNYTTKEDISNKSSSTVLGTSNTLYPTQNAVKTYVDAQVIATSIADANLVAKGKIRLGGDLAGINSSANDPIISENAINTGKLADAAVTDNKIVSIAGYKISGNILGDASNVTGTIIPLHGGTGASGTLMGYVKANGTAAMQAFSAIPVSDVHGAEDLTNKSNDITADGSSSTKYPSVFAVKSYVDAQIVQGSIPDATTSGLGKIKLGGDLAGPGTTASNPIIANGAITNSKIAAGAVSGDKIAGILSSEKGGTGVNNLGKTLTLGGDLSTTGTHTFLMNTTGPTNITIPTNGTLATLSGSESLSNKSVNGIQLSSGINGFSLSGGTSSKTLTVSNDATISGNNTGDQTFTLNGDIQGSGTGAINTTLINTGVVAGLYGGNSSIPQITVDSKGRISNISEIPVGNTSLAGSILNDGKILIGNSNNAADERILSGDVTLNNTGVTTIGNAKITNAMLAGNIDLSNKVSNVLAVNNGGTGTANLTNNALLVGGTNIGFIVPGLSGYVLSSNGSTWSANPISSLGVATTVGSVNTSGTANGLTLVGGEIKLSPADASNPGIISTGTQTFSGAKTFANNINTGNLSVAGNLSNSTLSVSKVVFSDVSKNLSSTGTVGVDQGGTGATSLRSGSLLLGNGTGAIITLDPSTPGSVLKVVGTSWVVSTPDRDESDQFIATLNQTSFTLTQTPAANSKVKMFINGIRIDKNAYTLASNIITYRPDLNSSFTLTVGDRIQFDYAY